MLHLGAPFQLEQPVFSIIYVPPYHHMSPSKEAPVTWYSILSKSYLGKHIHGGGCMRWIITKWGPYGLHCFVSFLFFLLFESSQCLVLCKSVSNKPFRCVRLQWGGWGGLKPRQKTVIAHSEIKTGGIFERPGRRNHGEILIIPALPVFVVAETLWPTRPCLHSLGSIGGGKSNCCSKQKPRTRLKKWNYLLLAWK